MDVEDWKIDFTEDSILSLLKHSKYVRYANEPNDYQHQHEINKLCRIDCSTLFYLQERKEIVLCGVPDAVEPILTTQQQFSNNE